MRWPIVRPRVRTVNANRIDTERLILRTPNPDYASEISRMIGNWRVAHWLVRVPYPYRIEHAVAWIERSNEERAAGVGWPFLIIRRDGNEMVGSIDLSIDDDNRSSGAIAIGWAKTIGDTAMAPKPPAPSSASRSKCCGWRKLPPTPFQITTVRFACSKKRA